MATSLEHYLAAEQMLRRVDALSPTAAEQQAPILLQEAQVHATLALAAATALNIGEGGEDYERWRRAASIEAELFNLADVKREAADRG